MASFLSASLFRPLNLPQLLQVSHRGLAPSCVHFGTGWFEEFLSNSPHSFHSILQNYKRTLDKNQTPLLYMNLPVIKKNSTPLKYVLCFQSSKDIPLSI